MTFVLGDGHGVVHADRRRGPREATTPARILVVDDDDAARRALENLLRADGFVTSTARDGETALAEVERARPDLVLTDLQMEPMNGAELCRRVQMIDRDLPIVVMTAFSDREAVITTLRAGAEDYLIKPLQFDAVLWCIERALARRTAKREQEELHRTLNQHLVMSSIREQEHAEAEAKQRAQLSALLEQLNEGVTIADQTGRVLMVNDAARVILGVEGTELRSIDALNSLDACDLDGRPLSIEERPLVRALRGENFKDYEVVCVRPNGERRRVMSTGTNVTENGNVALAIVISRDVTELRHLEQQRDEYLALISHDLRNPLSSILLLVATLKQSIAKKGSSEELNVSLAERAERNVKRMAAMLEELTDATSLELQGVALRRAVCDLRELVASVVDGMDDARARRVTIESNDPSSCLILADAPQLERVVANLLTNALKYSPEDAPVIARLARKGSDVALDVIDRGIGIASESVKMVFERYYRTTTGQARASGLGLGLYIARLIVEAHGGRIDLTSEVGKGSTFRVTLPSHDL